MKKQNKGITLIALIITIIVLLILAGVSVITLTGENGILTQVEDAQTKAKQGEAREKIQLEMMASIEKDGKYKIEKAKENLKKNLGLTEESGNVIDNGDGTLTVILDGYEFLVDNQGVVRDNGTISGGDETDDDTIDGETGLNGFDASTLTIGEAKNTDKYGWKVNDYTVATEDCPSGVWRLFYQDNNYTYLINDEVTTTTYKPSDYYNTITDENENLKYQSGADVSPVGQKLSSKINSLFVGTNENNSIRFTAWMTDPEVWVDYKDDNGDAVFAIGSPTIELYVASYNNVKKADIITLEGGTDGYIENTSGNTWLSSSNNDGGIYNKDGSSTWWLASPRNSSSGTTGVCVRGDRKCFGSVSVSNSSYSCRPIVCIPTSVFNSEYLDSVVEK